MWKLNSCIKPIFISYVFSPRYVWILYAEWEDIDQGCEDCWVIFWNKTSALLLTVGLTYERRGNKESLPLRVEDRRRIHQLKLVTMFGGGAHLFFDNFRRSFVSACGAQQRGERRITVRHPWDEALVTNTTFCLLQLDLWCCFFTAQLLHNSSDSLLQEYLHFFQYFPVGHVIKGNGSVPFASLEFSSRGSSSLASRAIEWYRRIQANEVQRRRAGRYNGISTWQNYAMTPCMHIYVS